MPDKTPVFKVGHNRRFCERDKTANFANETKPPIRNIQDRQFCKTESKLNKNKQLIQLHSVINDFAVHCIVRDNITFKEDVQNDD